MIKRFKGFTLIELLIVVAIIAILAAIAVPNFLEAQTRSKVARVQADIRTLATGLETYYIDNNLYPAQDSSVDGDGFGVNNLPLDQLANDAPLRYIPTFRVKEDGEDVLRTMTTPIAYLSSLPRDPFADTKSAIFAYSTNRFEPRMGWIVWSYGPDGDENAKQSDAGGETDCGGDVVIAAGDNTNPPYVVESTYDPRQVTPSDWLIAVTYDPSNGTSSNGDVYRLKQ
jgi:prepilin-type N-terminal cleavage/methylation domain-containing protein